MRMTSSLRVELSRTFRDPMTWLCTLIAAAMPLLGYSLLHFTISGETMADQFLADPSLAGALGGAIIFAVLTLLRMDRIPRSHVDKLTDAIVSPVRMATVQLLAVLAAATACGALTTLLYLPFTASAMGDMFRLGDYLKCYAIFMTMGMWLGCLLAAALYQLTRRADLTAVLLAAAVFVSLSPLVSSSYLLRWINPLVPALSDVYTNHLIFRTALYNRLFWLLMFGGAFCLSLICVRRYERGIVGSALLGLKRPIALALAAALIGGGALALAQQPYVNNAPLNINMLMAMRDKSVRHVYLRDTTVDLATDPARGTVQGQATYRLRNLNAEPTPMFLRIESGYQVSSLTANGEPVAFHDENEASMRTKKVTFDLPPGDDLVLTVAYGGMPKVARPMQEAMLADVISDVYVELTTNSFAPTLPVDPEKDSAPFSATVRLPGGLTPVLLSQTTPKRTATHPDGSSTWQIDTQGSTISLYAADFVIQDVSLGGMRVLFYHARQHESLLADARIGDAIRDVMDFCVRQYGALPYDDENPLRIMQSSVFLFGGFAGDNFSVMSETMFTGNSLQDPLRGASQYEVLAHELIHQWWGVSRALIGEDPEWSSEGFTVFTTYLMMKEKFGAEYAQQFYVDVWREKYADYQENFYVRHPEYLSRLPESYAAQINNLTSGTRRYCEMPLKMLRAAELLGGEEKVAAVLRTLFETEGLLIITYDDFLSACGLTREDLLL